MNNGIAPPAPQEPDTDGNETLAELEKKHDILLVEWEEHMSDFVPADLLSFEIDGRATEVLFYF